MIDQRVVTGSYRQADSFDVVNYSKFTMRLVNVIGKDGFIDVVEPELCTVDGFRDRLAELGVVKNFDTYIADGSMFDVTRGSVVLPNGVEYFFQIQYDSLYVSMVDGVLMGARLTGEQNVG